MRAALLLELGEPLEIEDVELLAPGPREAIVRTGATAVCITDVLAAQGNVMAQPRILGCQYGGATIRRDVPRFVGLMRAGLVDPAPIVDRRFSLAEINEAFAAAEAREVLTGVVVTG